MARTDWTALVTAPSMEYPARIDLERFCLRPYLPQQCRRVLIQNTPRLRKFPMFSGYLFLPVVDVDYHVLRIARGILKSNPTLTSPDGKLWRAPREIIEKIRVAEDSGEFDEKMQIGAKVQLRHKGFADIPAFIEASGAGMLELFTPLLGGSRLKTKSDNVVIATVP